MKKISLFVISVTLSFAMDAPSADYLGSLIDYLKSKSVPVNGTFYQYDFEKDGKIDRSDWLYIANNAQKTPYRLMGKAPTDQDTFGWLLLTTIPKDLNLNNPSGYFVKIDFPKDYELYGQKHASAFSWVYIVNSKVYKLMGAKSNHDFDYLDINGDGNPDPLPNLSASIDTSMQVHFNTTESQQSSSAEQKHTCEERIEKSYQGSQVSMVRSSWYQGNVKYNCKLNALNPWSLAVQTLAVDNIIRTENYDMQYDRHHLQGTATYNYKSGSVHIVGSYDNKAFNCYEYYRKIVPLTLHNNNPNEIENIMEEWGTDGPCDENFLRTTCPAWYYNELQECTATGQKQSSPLGILSAKKFNTSFMRDFAIYENSRKVDLVHTEENYKKE
ncbi:hypothetical protein NitYY0826_C0088 [Nitratiruptor sp. YY08-26]|uniref:hypothetical protein n=1 Tax=unclassified Nitratiruptor TaxID=2624044 RepID=UPI0019159BA7|nr:MULTISPECIES: hypothetical protein [unclassified Nitratiruptor]BCD61254.1 hypothetical protein NitYY0813_C0088 [Nitratiruptor sp. YY08-13]BCD65187.1 hypothetical protein NitYY0826_C0088 [Nitratiruptor sp. YY08-26]